MRKRQRNMMAGLLAAAGAVSAFFGVRALVSWIRRRSEEQEYDLEVRQRTMAVEIPAANISAQNYPQANIPSGSQETRMPEAGVTPSARTEMGQNYQSTFQPDQAATIPATGMTGAPAADMPREQERTRTQEHSQEVNRQNAAEGSRVLNDLVDTNQPVPVSSLVGPLIVHLLSFHNMINLLQQRREATAAGNSSSGPDVREGGADAVSSLEAQLPEFDRSALVHGSLQERIFQMMELIRETLKNTDNSEDQLFHISDKLRPAACKVLDLIQKVGADNVTGFEDVRKAYTC